MKNKKFLILGSVSAVMVIFLYLFFILLDFEFFRSDVSWYWNDSLNWFLPFNKVHVPGYSLIIAFARAITFGFLEPVLLMQMITMVFFFISIFFIIKIFEFEKNKKNDLMPIIGGLIFALWPFVGLTYIIYPVSDIVAISFYVIGLFLFLSKKERLGSLFWGFTIITHKGLWFFVVLSLIAWILSSEKQKIKHIFLCMLIIIAPIFLLWILGSFFYNDIFWIISPSLAVEAQSRSSIPIFDGLLSSILGGGLKAFVKGGLLLFIFFLSIILIIIQLKKRPLWWKYGIAISLSVLILAIGLNSNTIWAAVRFSRLLIFPIIWVIPQIKYLDRYSKRTITYFSIALLLLLYLSQFAFAYYMSESFFS